MSAYVIGHTYLSLVITHAMHAHLSLFIHCGPLTATTSATLWSSITGQEFAHAIAIASAFMHVARPYSSLSRSDRSSSLASIGHVDQVMNSIDNNKVWPHSGLKGISSSFVCPSHFTNDCQFIFRASYRGQSHERVRSQLIAVDTIS